MLKGAHADVDLAALGFDLEALDSFTSRPGVSQIETSIIYEATYRHDLVIEEAEFLAN